MMRSLTRLARMDPPELVWRTGALLRNAADRARFTIRQPGWSRRSLLRVIGDSPELGAARRAASAGRWEETGRALAEHLTARAPRFLIAPAFRPVVADRVRHSFPEHLASASARADRILEGEYDLLGYPGLRFDRSSGGSDRALPDWAYDPVHDRRAPAAAFWSSIPYLDPACGDHKVVWELNRHQHWLALGRAYWLTGDVHYRDRCLAELASWLAANPPLAGINWASMLELGIRSLSWLWALHFFADPSIERDPPWIVDLLVGLDRQLTQVERNLSYYFSPNTHLLGEGLALYVCGRALPEMRSSERWAATGRRILVGEIDRQIAADGGHCERSTHYHRYALDFYLLALAVARITGDNAAPTFERAASRLAYAARLLADDTGRLPHIGDDDGGMLAPLGLRAPDDVGDSLAIAAALVARPDLAIGGPPEEAVWWLAHPSLSGTLDLAVAERDAGKGPAVPSAHVDAVRSEALPETGYYVSRSAHGDHVVVDGGPLGFLNGGHGHADALALVLSVRGVPLLIDPGTGCYTTSPEIRDRLRSSALHNTVVVDGRSQSIPDGPFHWSHTASATVRRWRRNEAFDYFDGEHDGYRPAVHRRHVLAVHGDLLVVADVIVGSGHHAASAHWHFDPRWTIQKRPGGALLGYAGARVDFAMPDGDLEAFVADTETGLGWHSPLYGRTEPSTTVRLTRTGTAPLWLVTVFGLNDANPITAVDTAPIWSEAGALDHSIGIRIARRVSTDLCGIAEPAAGSADARWRLLGFETDARALFCRLDERRRISRAALVDGSMIRSGSGRPFQLVLPRTAADLHLDLRGEPRIAGPVFGARLLVAGREHRLESERRSPLRA